MHSSATSWCDMRRALRPMTLFLIVQRWYQDKEIQISSVCRIRHRPHTLWYQRQNWITYLRLPFKLNCFRQTEQSKGSFAWLTEDDGVWGVVVVVEVESEAEVELFGELLLELSERFVYVEGWQMARFHASSKDGSSENPKDSSKVL